MPTFCQAASLKTPESCTGRSLMASKRSRIASELRYGNASREGRMIRTHRYKYVLFNSGKNPEQFFDLARDPGEKRNLVNDSSQRKNVAEHRALLKQQARQTADAAFV
jgi:arylsulfatase A-like enzyme